MIQISTLGWRGVGAGCGCGGIEGDGFGMLYGNGVGWERGFVGAFGDDYGAGDDVGDGDGDGVGDGVGLGLSVR